MLWIEKDNFRLNTPIELFYLAFFEKERYLDRYAYFIELDFGVRSAHLLLIVPLCRTHTWKCIMNEDANF
jgi:hypothetical protein